MLQSINPATEEILGEFKEHSKSEVVEKTRKCNEAQKKWVAQSTAQSTAQWAAQSMDFRAGRFKKLAEVLRLNSTECAKLMTLEMGKPIAQSKAEVEKCALVCEYYAENAARFLKEEAVDTDAKKSYVRFDPLGVILGIMPWNFPFWQVFRFAVPAIIAGNGVLLKHASNVPQCALRIEKLFTEADFPDNLFKTLLIDSAAAAELIANDAVAGVSVTGSTHAGAVVAAHAGKYLKKCVLELGGSDPFIVLADADINLSCSIALQARTINTGQSCIAAKRFILEKSIAAEFEKKLIEHFKTLKTGNPMDETVNIGPLAKADLRDALQNQLQDAISKGAKLLIGGNPIKGKGYFFEPTLITNLTKNMAVYKEEVFGPLMMLFIAENENEALALANDSEFGLGASIWTRDIEKGQRLAAQIEAGCVFINGMVKSDPRLPFGGIKKSGFGRELGNYGIKEFVNIKSVVVN